MSLFPSHSRSCLAILVIASVFFAGKSYGQYPGGIYQQVDIWNQLNETARQADATEAIARELRWMNSIPGRGSFYSPSTPTNDFIVLAPFSVQQWTGVLAFAKSRGVALPFGDDQSAADGLLTTYQAVMGGPPPRSGPLPTVKPPGEWIGLIEYARLRGVSLPFIDDHEAVVSLLGVWNTVAHLEKR